MEKINNFRTNISKFSLIFKSSLSMSLFFLLLITWIIVVVQSSPQSKNLSKCSVDIDCDSSRTFLHCFNKQCQCSAINFFDVETNRCLIRVGGSCQVRSKTQYCVAFAECNKSSTEKPTAIMGTCHCRPKHKETIDSLCSRGVNNIFNFYVISMISIYSTILNSM